MNHPLMTFIDDDENVIAMRQTAEQIGINALVRELLASNDMVLVDMRRLMKLADLLGMDVMEELGKVLK